MPLPPSDDPRILLLAPTGRDAELAQGVLRREGLECFTVRDATALASELSERTGAVLLAEEALSPRAVEQLSERLAQQPPWSDLPFLLLASQLDARSSTARLERLLTLLGNVTIVERPVRIATLVTALKAALRARQRQYAARQTLEELARKEAALQLADQRKNEFLAMLAHELRNPMAAISTALQLMTPHEAQSNARNREMAKRQVQNLSRLVDDLLDVSRITRGMVELRKRPVSLETVIRGAVSAAEPALRARQHQLAVVVEPGDYGLEADATRLEQIVSNLLSNAAKYTEPGGRITVRLSSEETEGSRAAVLRVSDTGRGVPPHMVDKIFDLFVQVEQGLDRAMGGLGLGLTLVRQLSELHGGQVSVYSAGVGQGSEFTVRLPLPQQRVLALEPRVVALPRVAGRLHVLLVEDSEDIRESMKELIESMGHQVSVAANGTDGAQQVIALRPDVSLIDVGLPGMNGYEVARHVRAQPGGQALYLVALTGYGGGDARAKALAAGFDMHLTKPIDLDQLPEVLAGNPHQRIAAV